MPHAEPTSSGTPSRSCSTSPPRMPPTRRWPGLSLSLAARKHSPAAIERRHLASPPKVPRRTSKAARRGKTGTLNGLQLLPATIMTTTRKRMTPARSTSRPSGTESRGRHDHQHTTLRDSTRRSARTMHTLSSTSSETVISTFGQNVFLLLCVLYGQRSADKEGFLWKCTRAFHAHELTKFTKIKGA
jgi:hypothetical protein